MGSNNQRKTNEQAISESVSLHGDAYRYDKFNYVSSKTKVILFCNKHQEYFETMPSSHLSPTRKAGCPKCGNERSADACRSSTEDFIRKANAVQTDSGKEFDYSRVEYKLARTKVEIGCKTCGTWFMQSPDVHLRNKGCRTCMNNKLAKDRSHTKDYFVEQALKITGAKYNYDLVEYKNARTYVDILCNNCGTTFKKKPTEILNGHGCRCHAEPSGYSSSEPGNLYIMQCEGMAKIGITNLNPEVRAKAVSKSYGKSFQVIEFFTMDGQICSDIETQLIGELRNSYESPKEKFCGYTETFYMNDVTNLRKRIIELKEIYEQRQANLCAMQ